MELGALYKAFRNLIGGGEMLESVRNILFSPDKDVVLSAYIDMLDGDLALELTLCACCRTACFSESVMDSNCCMAASFCASAMPNPRGNSLPSIQNHLNGIIRRSGHSMRQDGHE